MLWFYYIMYTGIIGAQEASIFSLFCCKILVSVALRSITTLFLDNKSSSNRIFIIFTLSCGSIHLLLFDNYSVRLHFFALLKYKSIILVLTLVGRSSGNIPSEFTHFLLEEFLVKKSQNSFQAILWLHCCLSCSTELHELAQSHLLLKKCLQPWYVMMQVNDTT